MKRLKLFFSWLVGFFKPNYWLIDMFIDLLGKNLEKRDISHEIYIKHRSGDVYTIATKIIFYSGVDRLRSTRVFLTEFKQGKTKDKKSAEQYCQSYIDIFITNLAAYYQKLPAIDQGVTR